MARKKNTVSPATSGRPTTTTELSNLTNLNILLNSEVAELRKQLQLRAASNNSTAAVLTTVTPATPVASELNAGAETAAEKKQSNPTIEPVDAGVLSSTFHFTAAYCATHLPPAELDLAAKHSKQSVVSQQLPSVSTAGHGIFPDVDGVSLTEVEDGVFLMDMEEEEEDGILEDKYSIKWTEKMVAPRTSTTWSMAEQETKPAEQSKQISVSQLPSVSTAFYGVFLTEKDGMEETFEYSTTTEEMTASDQTSTSSMAAVPEFPYCKLLNEEKNNESGLGEKKEPAGRRKKSKWGFSSGGWIFSAGIVVAAVALAIFAASKSLLSV